MTAKPPPRRHPDPTPEEMHGFLARALLGVSLEVLEDYALHGEPVTLKIGDHERQITRLNLCAVLADYYRMKALLTGLSLP